MFSTDSFTPTYSGPILASGEAIRRARNSAMAQSEFAGNPRAFNPMMTGIGAGGRGNAYRKNIQGDVARSQGFSGAQQGYAENTMNNANANFQYQTNAAGEQSGLRGLLLDANKIDQTADLDIRQMGIGAHLQTAQREAENRAAGYRRKATIGGMLAGLFG